VKTDYGRKSARDAARLQERRATFADVGVMDQAAALWVLDNVLTHQRGMPYIPCACLHGKCGPCERGDCRRGRKHDQCLNVRRPSAYYGTSETWLTPSPGYAMGPEVWLADRTCRYRCPCTCTAGRPPCGCKGTPDDCCSACMHLWMSPATDDGGDGFLILETYEPRRRPRAQARQLALLPAADGYGTLALEDA
jgi:hypothetical protein